MNPDISFLHELWDNIKPLVPKKERLPVAEAVIRSFDDHADIESIEDHLNEFDTTMKAAIISHFDLLEDDDEEDDYGDW